VRFSARYVHHPAHLRYVCCEIVTCFAPEQNCAVRAIGAIDAARYEILVNAYSLPANVVAISGSDLFGVLSRFTQADIGLNGRKCGYVKGP
jgi:hypothetical protein